jgi:hypothetical protein
VREATALIPVAKHAAPLSSAFVKALPAAELRGEGRLHAWKVRQGLLDGVKKWNMEPNIRGEGAKVARTGVSHHFVSAGLA